MALAKMFEPLFARAARSYQAMVGSELKKYGLRYDDLLDNLYSTVRLRGARPVCKKGFFPTWGG